MFEFYFKIVKNVQFIGSEEGFFGRARGGGPFW